MIVDLFRGWLSVTPNLINWRSCLLLCLVVGVIGDGLEWSEYIGEHRFGVLVVTNETL